MPITEEQENQFKSQPFPLCIDINSGPEEKISFKGREALVRQFGEHALKWYATLDGKSISTLIAYGKGVNSDEADLLRSGLAPNQVPDSHFLIGNFSGNPQLFAIQRWVKGRTLKNIPLKEVIGNQKMKESLADLFIKCSWVYQETGRFPDLIGGDRIRIGRTSVQDPRKIIWPLRSPNIMIEGNTAVLVDAKKLTFDPEDFRFKVARLHHVLSLLTAKALRSF